MNSRPNFIARRNFIARMGAAIAAGVAFGFASIAPKRHVQMKLVTGVSHAPIEGLAAQLAPPLHVVGETCALAGAGVAESGEVPHVFRFIRSGPKDCRECSIDGVDLRRCISAVELRDRAGYGPEVRLLLHPAMRIELEATLQENALKVCVIEVARAGAIDEDGHPGVA